MSGMRLDDKPVWAVVAGCVAVALAATAGSYLGVVVPAERGEAAARAAAASSAEAEAEAASLDREAAALAARLGEREAELAATPVELGDVRDLNRRVAGLIRLAQDAGLEVFALQPGGAAAGEHYRVVPLRLEAGGGFAAQLDFLDRLHGVYPDVRVADVGVQARPREAGAAAQVVVELRWFTALDGAGGGGGGGR